MNFRQKLLYSAFGAAITLLAILAVNHLTPISAYPNLVHLDEIICKYPTVLNQHLEKSEAKIALSANRLLWRDRSNIQEGVKHDEEFT